MHELEERALDAENKSHQDFLFHMSSYPTPYSAASQRESVCLLPHLIRVITFIALIYSVCQDTPGRGTTTCNHFSQARTQTVPMAKKAAFLTRSTGRHVHRQDFSSQPHRKDCQAPREERLPTGLLP